MKRALAAIVTFPRRVARPFGHAATSRNFWSFLLGLALLSRLGATAAVGPVTAGVRTVPAISFDQIGVVAGKQYCGDGLAVTPTPEGARLNCAFQRLNAELTAQGLWLVSTADGAKGEPFRVIARGLGRTSAEPLARSGQVEISGQIARLVRPGLIEEYSVGLDGLRQDFVVERRMPGIGALRLELQVEGAKAEPMVDGTRLVLTDSGRNIVYHRLNAKDARGKALVASLATVSAKRLAIMLEDAGAEYPVRIDPTFSDANWISLGAVPGVNLDVDALAVSGSNLYVGGLFTTAGGVAANHIAQWNGSSWSALGSGLNGPNYAPNPPSVYALAVSGDTLYAAGTFITAGGVSATNIAKWNGSSWSAVGPGLLGNVYALAVSGGNVYAGGSFVSAGSVSANRIAKWDGTSWSALGSGMNGDVNALAVSGGTLYAGGNFTSAGGLPAYYVAQWNGTSWSALSGMNDTVRALAVSGGTLYAGGAFTTAGLLAAKHIGQWNGSSWSALGLGLDNTVYTLAISGSNLYVGGSFTTAGGVSATNTAQWNGSSWSALGSALGSAINNGVYALAISGDTLYAGGRFASAGGMCIARSNGSSWSALGSGVNGHVYALAISGNNLYAGGYFTTAGGVSATNIA